MKLRIIALVFASCFVSRIAMAATSSAAQADRPTILQVLGAVLLMVVLISFMFNRREKYFAAEQKEQEKNVHHRRSNSSERYEITKQLEKELKLQTGK